MIHVVLSIGTNIQREKNIAFALQEISSHYGELDISPVYDSVSVGFNGSSFLNLIVGFYTAEPYLQIRENLRAVEQRAGRVRGGKSYGNRVLDIDILLYGNEILKPEYNVPRDEIEKHAFVLKPLADLYPDKCHPVLQENYQQLWGAFDDPDQVLEIADFTV